MMSSRRRTCAAVLTVCALALTGSSAVSAHGALLPPLEEIIASGTGAPSIEWGACAQPELARAHAECAMLGVPLDYDERGYQQITLAVSRIRATGPASTYRGPLVSTPLAAPASLAERAPALGGTHDLIGFDLRGTGASLPTLSCDVDPYPLPQPAFTPVTDPVAKPGRNERAWLARWTRFTAGCDEKYGYDLRNYSALDSATDLESLRVALGAPTLSVLGSGYSAHAAALFATRHPQRVQRIVLSEPVNPHKVGYRAMINEIWTEAVAGRRFFAWIARHHRTYRLGENPKQVRGHYLRESRRLAAHPQTNFGPAEWNDTILTRSVADPGTWPEVAAGFSAWVRGNRTPILTHARGRGAPTDLAAIVTAYVAQACSDGDWPSSYKRWRRDALAATSPEVAFTTMLDVLACRTWSAGRPAHQIGMDRVGFEGAPPLLLLTPGANTPAYRAGLALRRLFPGSALISVRDSLATPGFNESSCVDQVVLRYLDDGILPALQPAQVPDATCRPRPLPTPNGDRF